MPMTTYDRVVKGFSVTLTSFQANQFLSNPAIFSVMPDQPCQLYTTYNPSFLSLAASFSLWRNSDYAEDVIVGVLDTRIWPGHPSFSDSGIGSIPPRWKGTCIITPKFPSSSCNRKIIEARAYFNRYKSDIGRLIDESNESKSPRDTEGHGTHTASTAAGSQVANPSLFTYAHDKAKWPLRRESPSTKSVGLLDVSI